jgi:hypothetical protein
MREDFRTLPNNIGKEFQAALDGMRQEVPEALEYKVTHSKAVTMREEPSVYSKELGKLQPGEIIKGFPAGSWLLVISCNGRLPPEGAWVLADGTALGVGPLLMPQWAELRLTSIREGVHAQWPGIKNSDVCYYLQWEPEFGIEGCDGSAVIVKQPMDAREEVVTIVSEAGLLEGNKVKLRAIARLKCGLLVGPWREHVVEAAMVDASSLKPAQVVPSDALAAETERYQQLVGQVAIWRKKTNFEYNSLDLQMRNYNTRPSDCEQAKLSFLNAVFGEGKDTRKKAAAEDNVQDMFAGATGVYEEGISGQCNSMLAAVIATLARKHG